MGKKGRVAVFLSGRGSNFEAIYQASQKPTAPYEIKLVISDKKNARGLARAREFRLANFFISLKDSGSKKRYEETIIQILNEYAIDLICLAGYMKIIGPELLNAYPARILNIHPALLPAFPGLDGQKQALDHGVKITGCTVHFVDSGIDTGPIILQTAVPVEENDNTESLSSRILAEEHKLYPKAIELFFKKRLVIENRRVKIINP